MFSVYGMQGRLFRGSLEQLRQVGGVGALTRTRRVLPIGHEGRDALAESSGSYVESEATRLSRASGQDDTRRSPLAAYAQADAGGATRRPLSLVRDVMSQPPVTLSDGATVLQAWQLLSEKSLGQAPVRDADGHLVGLLTRADLLSPDRLPTPDAHALVWQALMQQSVQSIMVTPVPSVAPDSDIRRVARALLDTGLPGLPVVDDSGAVIGFVSRSDILRAVVTDPPLDLWG
ncbi:MAG: histidine kinase [Comamonadaceae bacterium CG_4_9_14_0_8_um_filter_60_18]|nr:MAG: hypothetical protein AUK52_11825 [Comamonadaceae bacterium CG2_30_60_41]PJC12538.1 MAG: histidine kinase [Comamonadaceae bacterium CG_4_9_14_0_8_um_filter_60_18]